MRVIEGQYSGISVSNEFAMFDGEDGWLNVWGDNPIEIDLEQELIGVDTVHESKATSPSGGGTTGAAAGAVLGFLVAGPVGTVVGAGLGAKKRPGEGKDEQIIALSFASGGALVVENVDPEDLAQLVAIKARNLVNGQFHEDRAARKKKRYRYPPELVDLPTIIKGRSKKSCELPAIANVTALINYSAKDPTLETIDQFLVSETLAFFNEYNTFLWRYLDRTLGDDDLEFETVLIASIKHTAAKINADEKKLAKDLNEFRDQVEHWEQKSNKRKTEVARLQKEIEQAGFLGRLTLKSQLEKTEQQLKRESENLRAVEKKLATAKESSIDQSHDIVSADKNLAFKALEEFTKSFINLPANDFTKIKKSKRTSKLKLRDHMTLFETYRRAQEALDDEVQNATADNQREQIGSSEVETGSAKSRLLELKSLLDAGLISNDEFELKRSQILAQL